MSFRASWLPLVFACLPLQSSWALENVEWSGSLALESRVFTSEAMDPRQEDAGFGLRFEPEFYWGMSENSSWLLEPRFRLDQHDEQKNSVDVGEAYWQFVGDTFELKVGYSKVFWGRTEFVHLVDVINPSDALESIDGEDKLGQAMIEWIKPIGEGSLQLYVLPGFQTREFAGAEGRLRLPGLVDEDAARFESSAGDRRLDAAFRYNAYMGDLEWAWSGFYGNAREPSLSWDANTKRWIPHYAVIGQWSLDAVYVWENMLFKAEALQRKQGGAFSEAITAGVEVTQVGLFESDHDMGYLLEMAYQSERDVYSPFSSDVMAGLRWVWNDAASTEALLGGIVDVKTGSTLLSVESSRRMGDQIKLVFEGRFFLNIDKLDPLVVYQKDDHLKVEFQVYF